MEPRFKDTVILGGVAEMSYEVFKDRVNQTLAIVHKAIMEGTAISDTRLEIKISFFEEK